LTDEKRPYFTFAKKIEQAGEFQLIATPFEDGVDTVAFFSESRRLYITNTLLGYMKVEAPKMGAWEMYQLNFMDRDKFSDGLFQLKSVSRGRHIMHLREGNFHKGFHDKFGEVALFRMMYYDPMVTTVDPEGASASTTRMIPDSSSLGVSEESEVEASSADIRDKLGNAAGWKMISKDDRIPSTNPIVIYLYGDGFLTAEDNGDIKVTDSVEEATKFQICQVPNDTPVSFFSRRHGRYLSLGGLFSSKLRIEGTKIDNWEKFKLFFDKEQPNKCNLKVLKTWPLPTILRSHIVDKKSKSKALFTLLYNELQSI